MGDPYMGYPYMGHPYMGNPYMGNPYIGNPYMGEPCMGNPYMGHPYMGDPYMVITTDGLWTVFKMPLTYLTIAVAYWLNQNNIVADSKWLTAHAEFAKRRD